MMQERIQYYHIDHFQQLCSSLLPIIIINGCVLLVGYRKITQQRGPRAATGTLLPEADFSGR